jgi:hypothetical protein
MLTFPKKKGLSWFEKHSPPAGGVDGNCRVFFFNYIFLKENRTCWAGSDCCFFFLKKNLSLKARVSVRFEREKTYPPPLPGARNDPFRTRTTPFPVLESLAHSRPGKHAPYSQTVSEKKKREEGKKGKGKKTKKREKGWVAVPIPPGKPRAVMFFRWLLFSGYISDKT